VVAGPGETGKGREQGIGNSYPRSSTRDFFEGGFLNR